LSAQSWLLSAIPKTKKERQVLLSFVSSPGRKLARPIRL
jgi:hypothetical protein